MSAPVQFKGVDRLHKRLMRIHGAAPQAIARALYREGLRIVELSKKSYVPVDDGHLRRSIRAKLPKLIADGVVVELSAGGPSAPYATAVHEHPSPNSPQAWRGKGVGEILSVRERVPWVSNPSGGRGPKFLERPLRANVTAIAKRLSDEMKRVLGS